MNKLKTINESEEDNERVPAEEKYMYGDVVIKNSFLKILDSEEDTSLGAHEIYEIGVNPFGKKIKLGYIARKGAMTSIYLSDRFLSSESREKIKNINRYEIELEERSNEETIAHYERIGDKPWWLDKLQEEVEERKRECDNGIMIENEKYWKLPVIGAHEIYYDGYEEKIIFRTGVKTREYSFSIENSIPIYNILRESLKNPSLFMLSYYLLKHKVTRKLRNLYEWLL